MKYMVALIAKYVFWIVLCLPAVAAGVWLCYRLTKENRHINKEIEEEKNRQDKAEMERRMFEASYKNRYSGE